MSALSRGLRTLVVAGTIAVSSFSSCQPVYGAACVSKQIDGGQNVCPSICDALLPDGGDPTRDPTNACFTDGGTP